MCRPSICIICVGRLLVRLIIRVLVRLALNCVGLFRDRAHLHCCRLLTHFLTSRSHHASVCATAGHGSFCTLSRRNACCLRGRRSTSCVRRRHVSASSSQRRVSALLQVGLLCIRRKKRSMRRRVIWRCGCGSTIMGRRTDVLLGIRPLHLWSKRKFARRRCRCARTCIDPRRCIGASLLGLRRRCLCGGRSVVSSEQISWGGAPRP